MTDMIERVARAIAESHNVDPDDKVNFPDRTSVMWKEFVPQARAAIEAMRVPTDEMVEAGDNEHYGMSVWQAMIDAALRQEPTD